jgi:hypothetical protein
MLRLMKHEHFLAGVFLGLSLLGLPALGQDTAATNTAADAATDTATNAALRAAAVAEQQGMDEKFKQVAADIDSLRAANQLLLDKLSALNDDLRLIRAEQARLAAGAVGRDDLRPLAQRIEEVDKKRQEDKDAISEEIKKSFARVETLLTNAADVPSRPPVRGASVGAGPSAVANGFSYTIKEGDTLEAIVAAYNAEFKRKGMKTITLKQAMEVNPGVDWTRLKISQKIVIPRPPE